MCLCMSLHSLHLFFQNSLFFVFYFVFVVRHFEALLYQCHMNEYSLKYPYVLRVQTVLAPR